MSKKIYTFVGTAEELKKQLEVAERVEKKVTMRGLKDLVEPIENFLERYYRIFPDRRPKADRKFNCDRIDHDFQLEKDREDYYSKREELEVNCL